MRSRVTPNRYRYSTGEDLGSSEKVKSRKTNLPDKDRVAARVIAANRKFYHQIADKYEGYESCFIDAYLQRILEEDLSRIHSYLLSRGRTLSCLDCGGGTGNVALKMLARGWHVTVVDVSAEMLAILDEKARARRHSPTLIHSSLEHFLEYRTIDAYDLVAFSSVLHHLHSYLNTVECVTKLLRPGGIFYSNYDPVVPKNPLWWHVLDSLDIACAKLLLAPTDLLPGIGRRLRKLSSRNDPSFGRPVVSAADLAEFHARTGVDDEQVVRLLRTQGFSVLTHQRFLTGRTRAVRFLNERLRLLQSFKIIARRDCGLAEPELSLNMMLAR
jgi:SAM-dependent methyltransferase